MSKFIRSYGKYIVTLFLFIVVGYVLLYLTYKNVKQEMIEGLNARQLIHAKQAARGIEAFFGDHINILQNFSKNEHIVTLDESGKRLMRELISSHIGEISIIAREDIQGRILYAEPYDRRVIGQPVTQMEDFLKVKRTHQIAVSDVFTNRRGFKSIIVHVPVFKRGSFDGTFAMLISFDFIAKRYIEEIRIGKNGYAWAVSRDGTELSCPIPGHVGKSVFDNCREFPDILAMAERMIRGEQGFTTYMFDRIRGDSITKTTKHAVFMPIRLGDNFWSIVVATPEDEVMDALSGFRDRLLLIAIFLVIGIGFFLYMLIKTRIVIKEVEQRRKTEDALRESEERYRNLFENANEAIFVAQDDKLVFINPMTVMMIGYSSEELMAKPFIEFIHSDDRGMVIDRHVRQMKGEEIPNRYSFRIIRKDGNISLVELNAVLINWTGKPATLNFLSDITQKARAEEDSKRLASVVRHSLELVNLAKPDGTMVFLNDAGKKMLGISEEDVAQTNIMKVIPEHLRDKVQQEVLLSINKDGYWEGDLQYLNVKTGGLTDVHAITFKIADPETGTLQLLANISQDITERKQAEEALRESEKKYRALIETTQTGFVIIDQIGLVQDANPEYVRLTGHHDLSDIVGRSVIEWTADHEKETNAAAVGECFRKGYIRNLEIDYVDSKGNITPVEINATYMESGGVAHILTLCRDITERKRAEEALRESEEKYRWVLNNMADVITVMDMNLRFTYVSPSIMRMRGYTAEEAVAQTFEQVMTPESLQISAKVFEEELQLEASGTADPDRIRIVETEQYRKDGSIVLMENHLSFMRDEAKKPVGIIAVSHDITERRRVEEELQRTLESLIKAFGITIQVMISAVEARDPYTAGHQLRSTDLARAIATEMGLSQEKIEAIRMAGPIHDIGKLYIPAEILSKPTKLTNIEFSLIKVHPEKGYEMLKDVESPWPLAQIVYQHHERMDGSGYPRNLKGNDILIEARILAVADVVEAMASHRPYRPAIGLNAALEEIENNKGTLYDADAVDTCLRLFREKGFKLEGTD